MKSAIFINIKIYLAFPYHFFFFLSQMQLALIGGAGEIGRSLSQMLKQSSKLDVLALYDVAALNKRFSTPIEINKFCDAKITNTAVRFLYSVRGIYIHIYYI